MIVFSKDSSASDRVSALPRGDRISTLPKAIASRLHQRAIAFLLCQEAIALVTRVRGFCLCRREFYSPLYVKFTQSKTNLY
ncbi:hypothetical protein [Chroococcidiopsis sp. SAG 2025]|uniref:hypothetical protein n=1 Tax=Chroococcidiopsis sp. SAG 2025 TaxID=171389 RepID=UPI00293737D4|nr:hypothetical protein [Chroococcidiopsis sp. SAG 2025]